MVPRRRSPSSPRRTRFASCAGGCSSTGRAAAASSAGAGAARRRLPDEPPPVLRLGEVARVVVLHREARTPRSVGLGTVVTERRTTRSRCCSCSSWPCRSRRPSRWLRGATVFLAVLAVGLVVTLVVLWRFGSRPLSSCCARWPVCRASRGREPSSPPRGSSAASSGLRNVRMALAAFGLSVVSWLGIALSYTLALRGAGLELGLDAGILVAVATTFSLLLPALPASVGIFEAAALVALEPYDVDEAQALSGAVVIHVLTFVPFLILRPPRATRSRRDRPADSGRPQAPDGARDGRRGVIQRPVALEEDEAVRLSLRDDRELGRLLDAVVPAVPGAVGERDAELEPPLDERQPRDVEAHLGVLAVRLPAELAEVCSSALSSAPVTSRKLDRQQRRIDRLLVVDLHPQRDAVARREVVGDLAASFSRRTSVTRASPSPTRSAPRPARRILLAGEQLLVAADRLAGLPVVLDEALPEEQRAIAHALDRGPECETNAIVLPWRLNSRIRSTHFRWKASSPTANTSSSSRMSASTLTAIEKPSRMYMPPEYVRTGRSMKRSSSLNSTISSNRRSTSCFRRP